MLSRILNLPFKALGKAARAVQEAERERQGKEGPAPVGRSTAALRVGSPMDVPPEVDLGPMTRTAGQVLADREAGVALALVDVRSTTEHRRARPTGAFHMPDERVVSDIAEIPAGSRIVVIGDKQGTQARRVTAFLRFRGLEDAWLLDGGFPAWKSAGGPVTEG